MTVLTAASGRNIISNGRSSGAVPTFQFITGSTYGYKKEDVLFRNVRIRDNQLTYPQYLEGLYQHLSKLSKLKQKEIIYMSKDLPLFIIFISIHYWHSGIFLMKVHLRHPDFEKQQFDLSALPADIEEKVKLS